MPSNHRRGGGEPPPPGGEPPTGTDLESLLSEALAHFAAAETALRNGDLATYESELAEAEALVEQAQGLIGAPTATASPSP